MEQNEPAYCSSLRRQLLALRSLKNGKEPRVGEGKLWFPRSGIESYSEGCQVSGVVMPVGSSNGVEIKAICI